MPAWQRRYLVACAAVVGFCLAYSLCDFREWPRFTYFAVEHRWEMVAGSSGGIGSDYLGLVLWGVGGAAVAGAATFLATRIWSRELSRRWLGLAGAWALTAFLFAGLYFTWGEWPF